MNNPTKNTIIFLSVVAFLTMLFFYFFEPKSVPNIDTNKKFSSKSKQVYGLSVFSKLLSDKLGNNVAVDYNFKFGNSNNKNQAALVFGDDTYASSMNNPDFITFLSNGNDLYLFGENVSVNYDGIMVSQDTSFELKTVDTFYDAHKIAFPFHFKLFKIDSFKRNMVNVLGTTYHSKEERYDDEDGDVEEYVAEEADQAQDTTPLILADDTIIDGVKIDSTHEESSEEEDKYEEEIEPIDTVIGESILTFHGKPIFQKIKAYGGNIYVHSMPYIYTNIGAEDVDGYTAHFNLLLSYLKNKKVIITSDIALNGQIDESPFSIMLENRSLATAYYLALIIGLLYLIFGSKRIMKAIPLIEKVHNTSLEYTDTLARLYQKQGQPGRLVKKMEENFYFTMHKKFNVHRTDENYIKILSKKSKISESLIYSTVKYFEEIEKHQDCSDQQLEMLNNYLSNIEKQMNHGNKQ